MERARNGWLCFLVIALVAGAPKLSLAYTPTVTSAGIPVRWKGEVKLDFAGNPTNRVGLSPDDFFTAVVHGLERWNQASGGVVHFDYWQGTNPKVYEPNSDFNGLNSIYFASNAKGTEGLSPSVLGLTQVWYDTHTGQILETDIVLNDKDFHFTTNEQDTSGFGSGEKSSFGTRNRVFIENVITHELGHALGLSHSGGLQSTMLFMESPEQAHLSCDEDVAIHSLYPSDDQGMRGGISGTVRSESGNPIFGAHVLAISQRRGTVLATAMTDKDGHYSIHALEPGAYSLLVEPFFAGPAPLPAYYSGMNTAVCPDDHVFGRTALTDSSGYRLQTIDVNAGQQAGAPDIIAHCSHGSGASIRTISSSSSQASAPVIYDGTRDSGTFGATDKFGYSNTVYFKLHMISGDAEIHALAYSLYSPIHATIRLLDANGTPVQSRDFDYSYTGTSGYINYDTYLVARGLPPGDYFVEVSSSPLDVDLYPAGPVSLDTQPFLVVTGSVNEGAPALANEIPLNVRCRAQEHFAEYQSPPGPPPRHSIAGHDSTGGVGFCATLAGWAANRNDSSGGSSSGGGQGPTAGAIVGWFAPWALMLLLARICAILARRRRSRLLRIDDQLQPGISGQSPVFKPGIRLRLRPSTTNEQGLVYLPDRA